MSSVRVRFAPSPTGMVHVGSVRTALYNYLFAKKHGGTYVLRIEDTDQSRKVEGAVENLLSNMQRMGIPHDEGPGREGEFGPYFQSQRLSHYKRRVEDLVESGDAYPCFCTPQRLEEMRALQEEKNQTIGYDRKCLSIPSEQAQQRRLSEPHVIRMKVPDDSLIQFKDLVRGDVEVHSSTIDDQVLMKSDGFPTYHLANVVDDHAMKISHVIRGEEWLPSTPKHLILYEFFGWEKPEFAHLPLLLNPDRSKLSKRQGDVAVEDYLKKGYLEEALLNFLSLLGWNPGDDRELMEKEELIQEFDLKKVNKAGAVFDQDKLMWMNSQYLRTRISEERYLELVRPYASLEELKGWDPTVLDRVLLTLRNQLERPGDIREILAFFLKRPEHSQLSEGDCGEILKLESNLILFDFLQSKIKGLDVLSSDGLRTITRTAQKELSVKGKALFMPIRVALTGATSGPEVFVFAEGLGKEESLKRMEIALQVHRSLAKEN